MVIPTNDTVPTSRAMTRLGHPLMQARLAMTEVVERALIVYLVIVEHLPLLLVEVHGPGVNLVVILAAEHEKDAWITALDRKMGEDR